MSHPSKTPHLVAVAEAVGALSDDGMAIQRDSDTENYLIVTRRYGRRGVHVHYFRSTVTPDEAAELQADILALQAHLRDFAIKWEWQKPQPQSE